MKSRGKGSKKSGNGDGLKGEEEKQDKEVNAGNKEESICFVCGEDPTGLLLGLRLSMNELLHLRVYLVVSGTLFRECVRATGNDVKEEEEDDGKHASGEEDRDEGDEDDPVVDAKEKNEEKEKRIEKDEKNNDNEDDGDDGSDEDKGISNNDKSKKKIKFDININKSNNKKKSKLNENLDGSTIEMIVSMDHGARHQSITAWLNPSQSTINREEIGRMMDDSGKGRSSLNQMDRKRPVIYGNDMLAIPEQVKRSKVIVICTNRNEADAMCKIIEDGRYKTTLTKSIHIVLQTGLDNPIRESLLGHEGVVEEDRLQQGQTKTGSKAKYIDKLEKAQAIVISGCAGFNVVAQLRMRKMQGYEDIVSGMVQHSKNTELKEDETKLDRIIKRRKGIFMFIAPLSYGVIVCERLMREKAVYLPFVEVLSLAGYRIVYRPGSERRNWQWGDMMWKSFNVYYGIWCEMNKGYKINESINNSSDLQNDLYPPLSLYAFLLSNITHRMVFASMLDEARRSFGEDSLSMVDAMVDSSSSPFGLGFRASYYLLRLPSPLFSVAIRILLLFSFLSWRMVNENPTSDRRSLIKGSVVVSDISSTPLALFCSQAAYVNSDIVEMGTRTESKTPINEHLLEMSRVIQESLKPKSSSTSSGQYSPLQMTLNSEMRKKLTDILIDIPSIATSSTKILPYWIIILAISLFIGSIYAIYLFILFVFEVVFYW